MDILWALILAFGIHTLDNMWVNWLNYKISTQAKDSEEREDDNDNNGVDTMNKMGFTQGYRTGNDGKKEEG